MSIKDIHCCDLIYGAVKCPRGRLYQDSCGNDCTCFESTGAVFCNEKRRCPQDNPQLPILHSTTAASIIPPLITKNTFLQKRNDISPSFNLPPLGGGLITSASSSPAYFPTSTVSPLASSFQSRMALFGGAPKINEHISLSSTPIPLNIAGGGKSQELIIEPAIIIRKKGSKQASVVRSPSSATSVTLTSRNDGGNAILLNKPVGHTTTDSLGYASSSALSKLTKPLHLYHSQLKRIMDIRRAYSNLLQSKVNFNMQIASGKTPTHIMATANGQNNLPFNRVVVLQERNHDKVDHPRRFDENYENNTILMGSTPGPPPFPLQIGETVKPLIWRKELKKVINNFSPVPPLKQLVSYVTTSTESYLSQFLNHLGNKSKLSQASEISTVPSIPPTFAPPTVPPPPPPPPMMSYPYQPFSTIEPFHEISSDPSSIPIHQVYQNHKFKKLATPLHSLHYNSRSGADHAHHHPPPRFPYMNELMEEIARVDHFVPTATPRTSPALTALPTFQTPGPPYAEIDVVQPLSFLPPPNPEPATPTRRAFISTSGVRIPPAPQPTVRVNLDKPIYIHPPPPSHQHSRYPPLQTLPRSPSPPLVFPPPQHNRRLYSSFPVNNPAVTTSSNYYPKPHPPPLQYAPPPTPPPLQPSYQNRYPNPPPPLHRYPSPPLQYFIPTKRPKQYRLVLKGSMREAATRVDDVVPRFVSRIAQEFFKKPEIYVPKIRPGKPLTLEKVILNHKEIVPKEMIFDGTPTKLQFTPEAQWEMKEELAHHGIMLNEPLITHTTPIPGEHVMNMDAPVRAVQTWESHTGMDGHYSSGDTSSIHAYQEAYKPAFLPSPLPPVSTLPPPTTDHQLQQELQHQLSLAQQSLQDQLISSTPPPTTQSFTVDPGDYNDWTKNTQDFYQDHVSQQQQDEQIVLDKYVVRDPSDGTDNNVIITTTTAAPPTDVDIFSILRNNNLLHRSSSPLPVTPTPPPAVLIRHHGAPSPMTSTTVAPLQFQFPSKDQDKNNLFVTVINSTPSPIPFVTTTISPIPSDHAAPTQDIASQIHEMLMDEMNFGARTPDLYDMLFRSRAGPTGAPATDQLADAAQLSGEVHDKAVDTDRVASIFTQDYKEKVGRKPPEVIVIRVPPDHSDGPFPKVVEKRRDGTISTEKSVTTSKPNDDDDYDSDKQDLDQDNTTSEEERIRRNKRKRKRKRRKKKKKKEEEDRTSTTPSSITTTSSSLLKNLEAENKFQSELDWKSQLMANICDLNPSSPLCLTYRSICLLMTSSEGDH